MDSYIRFAQFYDLLMDEVDYNGWASYIKELIDIYEISKSDVHTILDCACGTGSITIPLIKSGYSVMGMDLSNDMLDIASNKMRKFGMKCHLIQGDMKNITLNKKVDAVTSCCDGVNYLKDITDVDEFFTSCNKILKSNGLLLFDISSEYKLQTVLGSNTFGEDREECTYLWENYFDNKSNILEMYLHFFVKNKNGTYDRFDETHIQKAYSVNEIVASLNRSGFEVLGIFDAFTMNSYKNDSERIQFVSRRK